MMSDEKIREIVREAAYEHSPLIPDNSAQLERLINAVERTQKEVRNVGYALIFMGFFMLWFLR